jgi:hypothetical protein
VESANRRKQAILTDAEVAGVSNATVEFLHNNFGDHPFFTRAQVERTVRMIPLGVRCSEAREQLGASLKDIARQLRVPQYRLRAIESGSPREVRLDVLQKYIVFLRLERWYAKWRRANGALLAELEPTQGKGSRRGRTTRCS